MDYLPLCALRRLSSFGFLCLTEDTANAGLEDLLLGLSWLQRWLPWFGGDPARVTLAGESAGSAAVSPVVEG